MHWAFLEDFQAIQAQPAHPLLFAFHLGDLLNNFAAQSLFGLKRIVFGNMEPRAIRLLLHIEYLTHRIYSICTGSYLVICVWEAYGLLLILTYALRFNYPYYKYPGAV